MVFEPKKKRSVTWMAITSRTGNVSRGVPDLDIIKQAPALPPTTRTFNSLRQKSIARFYVSSSPGDSPKRPRRTQKSEVADFLPVPGNDHRDTTTKLGPQDGGVLSSVVCVWFGR